MNKPKFAIKSFLFELLIVFIGVYGAFELNRYQQRNREKKVEINYLTAFLSELNNIRYKTVDLKNQVTAIIKKHEDAAQNGTSPDLEPPNFYYYHALLITQIGLSDDVFVQLSPGLAPSLSGGYDFIQRLSMRVKDFNDLCNDKLIANEPLNFYEAPGQLKDEYGWYLSGLRQIDGLLDELMVVIDEGAMPSTQQLLESLN